MRERILEAVKPEDLALHEALRRAGERLLALAIAMPPSRETAVTLLAADALMTFACEATAEFHPDQL